MNLAQWRIMRTPNRRLSLLVSSVLAFAAMPAALVACSDDNAAAPAPAASCPTPTTTPTPTTPPTTPPTGTTPPPATGAHVASAVLKSLDVVEVELGDPVTVDHPVTVEMSLEVNGEAFTTNVGVGIESADGTKRCFLGAIEATHATTKEMPVSTATLSLVKDFFVPPSCRPLVGESNAHVWVSFDMFGRLNLDGRTPLAAGDETKLEEFLQQSRLKLDQCSTIYADTCEQPFAVKDTPGRDLVLSKVDLSTSVGVLEYQAKTYLPEVAAGDTGPDGQPLTPLDMSQFFARVSTTPQVVVNTTVKVYGGDGTDADALPPGTARVSVYLAPNREKNENLIDLDAQLPIFEPEPMSLEVVKQDKASNLENILRLQRESVDRLVDAQEVTTVSSAFIDGPLLEKMTSGMWSKINSYTMTVCVESDLQEASPQGPDPETGELADPLDNNCRELEFEVVRRPRAATLDGLRDQSAAGIDGAAAEKAFSSKWDPSLGDSDKVKLGLRVSAGVRGDSKAFDIGFNALLETRGWVNFPLGEVDLALRDYVDNDKKDETRKKLNFLLWNNESNSPLPEGDISSLDLFGEKDKDGKQSNEITKDGPDLAFAQSAGPITIIAIAKFTGTVGAKATLNKKPNKSTASCDDGKKIGESCLRPVNKELNFYEAESQCRDMGGTVASPTSQDYYDALQSLRKSMNTDVLWTSLRHINNASKQVGSCREFERARNDANNRLQDCYGKWYKSNSSCDKEFKGERDSKENAFKECEKDFGGKPGYRPDWLSSWTDDSGTQIPSSIPWLPGNPDDHGSGEGFVALHDNGLNDAPSAWKKPVVCDIVVAEGTFFGVTVKPYARVSSKFFAKLSFGGVVEGGVEGDLVLGELNFTNEGGINWSHVPDKKSIYSYVSMKSNLEATVLKGKIDYFFRINVPFIPDAKGELYKNDEGKKIPLATFINEKSKVYVLRY